MEKQYKITFQVSVVMGVDHSTETWGQFFRRLGNYCQEKNSKSILGYFCTQDGDLYPSVFHEVSLHAIVPVEGEQQ